MRHCFYRCGQAFAAAPVACVWRETAEESIGSASEWRRVCRQPIRTHTSCASAHVYRRHSAGRASGSTKPGWIFRNGVFLKRKRIHGEIGWELATKTSPSTLETLIYIIRWIKFLVVRSSVIYHINTHCVYCEKYIVFIDPKLTLRTVFYHKPSALRERQAKQTGRLKKDIGCRSVFRSDGQWGYQV